MTPSRMPISVVSGSPATKPADIPSFDSMPNSEVKELDPQALDKLRKQKLGNELVDWVRSEYSKCKQSHTSIRSQWYMNLSFFAGDQYVEKINGQILKTRAPKRQIRMIINRVRPMILTRISQMTSQKPTAEVVPSSAEIEDLLAAEAGQALFENAMSQYGLQKTYAEQTAFWQAVTGTGYIKTYWDKSAEDGNGCFKYSAPSPFHVLVPELLTTEIEDQPYVLNVYTKPLSWVKQVYGDALPKDHKPTVVGTTEVLETQYLNIKDSDRKSEPDSCLFIEAWIKPGTHKDLPKGALLTIIDDILIQACLDGMPYEHGQYPFTKFGGVPSGGYYGTSPIDDYIQLQVELNRNRSLRASSRNLTANPGYMAPKGSVDVAKWHAAPGQVVEYMPGMGKPEPLQQPQLPNYVIQEEQALLSDMEDVSGQHQQTRGGTNAGITSGTAISFLQEADNSYMATVFLSIEKGFEKIGKQTIGLFVQYVDVPRMVKITGGDTFSVQMLAGTDLKSADDLRVESGSSMPQSRTARNAMFMDMIQKGIIPVQAGLRQMHLSGMKEFFDRTEIDQRQAQRENQKMSEFPPQLIDQAQQMVDQQKQMAFAQAGIDPATATMSPVGGQIDAQFSNMTIIPVNDWDNHEAHIEEHQYFMKSQRFESLPQQVKDEFERHVKAHKDALQQSQMQDMFAQMGMGQPGQNPMQPGMPSHNQGGQNQFSGLPPAGQDAAGIDAQKPTP